jgi:hypothetical protein
MSLERMPLSCCLAVMLLAIFPQPSGAGMPLVLHFPSFCRRGSTPQMRGSLEHPHQPPAQHARAPCFVRPSHGRLAQRRSQAVKGQGDADLHPLSPWPVGTNNAGDGEALPRRRSEAVRSLLQRKTGGWEALMTSGWSSSRGAATGDLWTTSSSCHHWQHPRPPAAGDHSVSQQETTPVSFSR